MKPIYTRYKILIITILMTGAFLPSAAVAVQDTHLKAGSADLEDEPDCERLLRFNAII